MAKIVKLKIPLIFFSEFCPSNNSKPVLILIVTQEKRLGVNIWPIIGIIKPRSWPKLSGTYGMYKTTFTEKSVQCFLSTEQFFLLMKKYIIYCSTLNCSQFFKESRGKNLCQKQISSACVF